jgi:hypothetical protein
MVPHKRNISPRVFGNLEIDEFATASLERSQSTFLVNAHQLARRPFTSSPSLSRQECPFRVDFVEEVGE